jgi:hypothetical protein
MTFDIITTQYALSQYPTLQEGNVFIAPIVSSFWLFLGVKAFGTMFIIGMYKRISAHDAYIAKMGKAVIISLMLIVVGNNMVQIASAISYSIQTPNSLEYPGRVSETGEVSYAFTVANGTHAYEFGIPETNGTLSYNSQIRVTSGYGGASIVFVVTDWANPNRIYMVDSLKNVLYTDFVGNLNYATTGYKTYGSYPDDCPSCDAIYKIGVLTDLNTQMSGFTDSNGDLYLGELTRVVKFVRSADFTKTTYLTVAPADYTSSAPGTDAITSIRLDSDNNMHVLLGGSGAGGTHTERLNHVVYSGTTRIHTGVLASITTVGTANNIQHSGILIDANSTANKSTDVVFGYSNVVTGVVYLRGSHGTTHYDVCPGFCAAITGFNGLQILNGYAYIASSAENKIYRFPTNISVYSGSGFVPGVGTGATDPADITYVTKTIQSVYTNYYNTSPVYISAKLDMDSGYNLLGDNYLVNLQDYRWRVDLIDPNGVTVSQSTTGACSDAWEPLNPLGRCTLTIFSQYTPPSNGWQSGYWTAKLYEVANGGHVALLTTSNTWNVYNGSINNNASTIPPPIEPISSISNQESISVIDGYVTILGMGLTSVSKLLFALLIITITAVVAIAISKNGMIGMVLAFAPYIFFTYINYIPKWIFIIVIILLAIVSKVFR